MALLELAHDPEAGQLRLRLERPEATTEAVVEFRPTIGRDEFEALRWLIEDRDEDAWQGPHGEGYAAHAGGIARAVGLRMFEAVFGDSAAASIRDAVLETLSSTDVHVHTMNAASSALPWELMTEPIGLLPIAVHARSFARSVTGASEPCGPPVSCRVLLVISRPNLTEDVPMSSVASQILRSAAMAGMPLSVEVARPPTFDAVETLLREAATIGMPYSAVHFDGHGVFCSEADLIRGGLSIRPEHADRPAVVRRGYLVFEGPGGTIEAVSGSSLGTVCHDNGVGCVVLNACQSAMDLTEGGIADWPPADKVVPRDTPAYGSLATELVRSGVAGVVAMRYAVRVEAAATIMRALYDMLFAGIDLAVACTAARRAVNGPTQDLEWLVPAVYLFPHIRTIINPGQGLPASSESSAFGNLPAADTFLLQLDRAFDRSQVVFLRGWPGTGKSAIAAAFAYWYAMTGGCQRNVVTLDVTETLAATDVARLIAGIREMRGTIEVRGTDAEGRAALTDYGERLITLPNLVILDHFELIGFVPTAQRTEILELIRDHREPDTKILVVSCRYDSDFLGESIPQITVGQLSDPSAMQLALRSAGREMSDQEAKLVVAAADGIPALIVRWSALVPRPASGAWWLGPGAAFPPDADPRTATYIARAIETGLTADDRLVLSVLCFFHRRVSADALTMLLFPEHLSSEPEIQGRVAGTVQRALTSATQLGLLEQETRLTYRIHPCLPAALAEAREEMLQDSAHNEPPTSEADIADRWLHITARLANEIRNIVEEGYHHARIRLNLEMDNILAAFDEAKRRSDWQLIIQLLQSLHAYWFSQGHLGSWPALLAGVEDEYLLDRDQPRWRTEMAVYLSYRAELAMIRDDPRQALSIYVELLTKITSDATALLDRSGLTDQEANRVRTYGVVEEKTAQILGLLVDPTCFIHFDAAQRAYQYLDDGQAEAVLLLLRAEAHRALGDPDQALLCLDRAMSRLNPYDRDRRSVAWLVRGLTIVAKVEAHFAGATNDPAVDRLLDDASEAFANSAAEAPTERGIAEAERQLARMLNTWERSPEIAAAAAMRAVGYYARVEPGSAVHLGCLLEAGIALHRTRRGPHAAIQLRTLVDLASPVGETARLYDAAERLLSKIDAERPLENDAGLRSVTWLVERVRGRLDDMGDDPRVILDPQAKIDADGLLEQLTPPVTGATFTDAIQAVAFLFQMRSQARPELEYERPVARALFAILHSLAAHKVPGPMRQHFVESTSESHPAVLAAALATDMADDPTHSGDDGWLDTTLGLMHTATVAFPADEPSLSMYLFNLANTWRTRYIRLKRPSDLDQAIEVGRKAVLLTPEDHPRLTGRLTNLAITLQMRFEFAGNGDDRNEAVEIRQRIAELSAAHHHADWPRADELSARGEQSAAEIVMESALAGNVMSQERLGRAMEHSGDVDAAISWYLPAAQGGVVAAMTRLGIIYYRKGDRAAAQPWLEQAAEHSDSYAMYILGGFATDRGDDAAAQHWWRRAAELDDANAMLALADVLMDRGELEEAERLLRHGSSIGHPFCMRALAKLLRYQGHRIEARLWKARAKATMNRLGPPQGIL